MVKLIICCVQTVIIKSMERNVASMYEARRQLVVKEGNVDVSVTASETSGAVSSFSSLSVTTPVYTRPGTGFL